METQRTRRFSRQPPCQDLGCFGRGGAGGSAGDTCWFASALFIRTDGQGAQGTTASPHVRWCSRPPCLGPKGRPRPRPLPGPVYGARRLGCRPSRTGRNPATRPNPASELIPRQAAPQAAGPRALLPRCRAPYPRLRLGRRFAWPALLWHGVPRGHVAALFFVLRGNAPLNRYSSPGRKRRRNLPPLAGRYTFAGQLQR